MLFVLFYELGYPNISMHYAKGFLALSIKEIQ